MDALHVYYFEFHRSITYHIYLFSVICIYLLTYGFFGSNFMKIIHIWKQILKCCGARIDNFYQSSFQDDITKSEYEEV